MRKMRVLGMLSGTSMDAIDLATAELCLEGDTIGLTPLGDHAIAYPTDLSRRLQTAIREGTGGPAEWCALDNDVGNAMARAVARTRETFGDADLVGCLGQTIHHSVQQGTVLGTLQIGQPAWIAETSGLPVITNMRARDVAAGGHGAPLAVTLDTLWLNGCAGASAEPVSGSASGSRGVTIALNIGGIANITVVGGQQPLAYDTGPGNALIDAAAELVTAGRQCRDTDGHLARAGSVREDLLTELGRAEHFRLPPPKSTGKEEFGFEQLRAALDRVDPVRDEDLVATVTDLTARTIAEECARFTDEHTACTVVASGGGVANPTLMNGLRQHLDRAGITLSTSEELGLPVHAKEAYLAALLGYLAFNGITGNVPSATGARGPRPLGEITPGSRPLRLPPPAETPVRVLRIHDGSQREDAAHPEEKCVSSTWQ